MPLLELRNQLVSSQLTRLPTGNSSHPVTWVDLEQGTHFKWLLNKSCWYPPPWAAARQVKDSPTSGSPPPNNTTITPQWICFAITLKTKICLREPYFAVKRHLRSVASLVDAPGMVLRKGPATKLDEFLENSKLLLTTPPHFWKNMLQIFIMNMVAYMQGDRRAR